MKKGKNGKGACAQSAQGALCWAQGKEPQEGWALALSASSGLWRGPVEGFLGALPKHPGALFDLAISSPPYNIGKEYEARVSLKKHMVWQTEVLEAIVPRIKESGSLVWQTGNFIKDGEIWPLDLEFAPILKALGMKLRNRVVWRFGHGLHAKKRFSGRHETALWFTKGDEYFFDLDAVRVPSKYPGKKHFKGPKAGAYSGNPLGKNPEDVWDIPNVKSNHPEKTNHPCQFPVGLCERFVLALCPKGGLVFDPFAGVASAGVAAISHGRRFWGAEKDGAYAKEGFARLGRSLRGEEKFRSHLTPLYDHAASSLSKKPAGFK